MQSISSASDSSLSAGREASNLDGEFNRDERVMRDSTTCGVSNVPGEELQHESSSSNNDDAYDAVDASSSFIVKRLKELYQNHVLDAEKLYHLHFNFCLPTDGEIKESEFDATPMVLLIGQYSTGKVGVYSRLVRCQHASSFFLHVIDEDSLSLLLFQDYISKPLAGRGLPRDAHRS